MYRLINTNKQAGFTMLELMLVVASVGLVAAFSITLGSSFLWRMDLSQAQYGTVVGLRRAQILAQAAANDADWGVHIEENQLTVFKGNDFNARDIGMDEIHDLGGVFVSSPVNIIYRKFSGLPSEVSLEISSEINLTANQETAVISINSEGMIDY